MEARRLWPEPDQKLASVRLDFCFCSSARLQSGSLVCSFADMLRAVVSSGHALRTAVQRGSGLGLHDVVSHYHRIVLPGL